MRRPLWNLSLVLLATLGLAADGWAQGVTTAAVSGRVSGPAGQPLATVQVAVTNTATGVTTGALSGVDGRYYVPHLQPGGPYAVEAQSIGYETQRRDGIRLVLGQNYRVDFQLEETAVQLEGLIVTSDATFSQDRTGQQTTVTQEQLLELPTLTRNFTELASLSPLVSSAGVGASVGGQNNRFNNIQIDGAVSNDVFGLADSGVPGGQANGKPISQDAIEQFQILVAPFDVRQAGFTGGLINAVSKSGTNEIHGSLYGFFRNQSLLRDSIRANNTNFLIDDFDNSTVGFTLGGPLKTDKVHFFLSGEYEGRNRPNALGFESGGNGLGLDPTSITQVESIAQGYGLEFGDVTAYTRANPALNLFGRLDFQLSPEHRLSVKHTYASADDDDSPSRGGGFFEPKSATYVFNNETNTSVVQLFSSLGDGFSNEFLANVQFVRDQRAPEAQFQYSTIRVDLPDDPVDPGATIQFGAERFSHANSLDQDILQLTNNLTRNFGAHRATFGVNAERWAFNNLFVDRSLGQYDFDSPEDLEAGLASFYALRVPVSGGPVADAAAVFAYWKLGVYAQDEWAVSDQLNLTYGLRVDVPVTGDTPRDNVAFGSAFGFPTTEVPSGNPLWQPRIGFNYQPDASARTQIRGGAGLFAGRPPFVWIANAFGNTGLESVELQCSDTNVPAFDPNNPPATCADGSGPSAATPSIATVDPDFKFPTELKIDLAVDREFGDGWRGTIEGIYTKAINQVAVEELNGAAPSGESSSGLGIGDRTIYGSPIVDSGDDDPWAATRVDGGFNEVVRMTNTSEGYSYAVIGELEKRFDRLNVRGAYTYSRSFDIQSMTSSRAISNYGFNPIGDGVALEDRPVTASNFDRPHRVIVTANALLWPEYGGTNLALIYRGQSGGRYSYVYDGDINGDGFAGNSRNGGFSTSRTNDLVYVPASSSELAFRSADDERLFNELVDMDPCLSEARGSILERNACSGPWTEQLDLRLTQGINTPRGQVELVVDVFNVLNLLNSSWGLQEGALFNTAQLLRTRGREGDVADGRVLFTYDGFRTTDENDVQHASLPYNVFSASSRYQINLGLRWRF